MIIAVDCLVSELKTVRKDLTATYSNSAASKRYTKAFWRGTGLRQLVCLDKTSVPHVSFK